MVPIPALSRVFIFRLFMLYFGWHPNVNPMLNWIQTTVANFLKYLDGLASLQPFQEGKQSFGIVLKKYQQLQNPFYKILFWLLSALKNTFFDRSAQWSPTRPANTCSGFMTRPRSLPPLETRILSSGPTTSAPTSTWPTESPGNV